MAESPLAQLDTALRKFSFPGTRLFSREFWLLFGLFFATALVIYSPSLGGPFLSDDNEFFPDSKFMGTWQGFLNIWTYGSTQAYFPLTYTTFWAEHWLFGDWAPPYRVINIALHAACAVLLVRALLAAGATYGFWIALIFLVHPLNVSSVAWVIERKNVLSFFLVLLSLNLLLKEERKAWFLSQLAFIAAVLAKVTVAMFAPVFALLLYLRAHPSLGPRMAFQQTLARVSPYFLFSLMLGVSPMLRERLQMEGSPSIEKPNVLTVLGNMGECLGFYISKTILPTNLTWAYDTWRFGDWMPTGFVWLGGVAMAATAGIFLAARRDRFGWLLLFCLCSYLIVMFPFYGFLHVAFMEKSPVADHWQYHAMPFLLLILTGTWIRLNAHRAKRTWEFRLGFLLLIAASLCSALHATDYASARNFWRTLSERAPKLPYGHGSYARLLAEEGDLLRSAEYFKKALELSNWKDPDMIYAYGNSCLKLNRLDEAVRAYRLAVQRHPELWEAYSNLGVAYLKQDDYAHAKLALNKALEINPNAQSARQNLALLEEKAARRSSQP